MKSEKATKQEEPKSRLLLLDYVHDLIMCVLFTKCRHFIPFFLFLFHNYCQYRYIVTLFQYISRTSFHCRKEHTLAWTIFLLIISEQINDLISYRQSDVGREW